ncbi:MAG: hypothetical protein EPO52_05695 [Herbiconiux sp.]|uniref:hypothetical protein n=1 Tax=Herbiconiux sp. TaxID=1871186 RepID=UPI0011FFA2ED|nr:hypothetical protein [Herbiconiux sp.]TAJ48863.1 MAG: hypothetical protein EPO52_05695 [Herbiconiux sp.]
MPLLAQQIVVTVLTVAAFVLSAIGLWGARRGARKAAMQMDVERQQRADIRAEYARLGALAKNETGKDRKAELEAEQAQYWMKAHAAKGLEAWSYTMIETGRELLAERMIRGLDSSSRVDVILLGIGLVCGLTAGIWGTWLPNA